jgi:vancomycin resistance protein VanJ
MMLWLWLEADVAWAATLLMFSPRWMFAYPFAILVPLAVVLRHRWAVACTLIATVVALGPFSGGVVNWPTVVPPEQRIRILTLNCDGELLDRPRLFDFLNESNPDVIAFQDVDAETLQVLAANWNVVARGRSRAIVSRHELKLVGDFQDKVYGDLRGAMCAQVKTKLGELTVVNVHLPTPRVGLEAVIHRDYKAITGVNRAITLRTATSTAVSNWVGPPSERTIVVGDFNLPPTSAIFQRDWSTWTDAFTTGGVGWGWTMRARWSSVRIDRVLLAPPWRCRSCWVGPNVGPAHRPVIADLELSEAP